MAPIHHAFVDSLDDVGRRSQRITGPWAMKSIVANKIRNGTKRANVTDGVAINNHAPKPPPTTLITPSRIRINELSFISRRYPNSPPNKPGHRATVQVAFANFGSVPNQINSGNTSNIPPPAIEFTTPAKKAATNINAAWLNDIRASLKEKFHQRSTEQQPDRQGGRSIFDSAHRARMPSQFQANPSGVTNGRRNHSSETKRTLSGRRPSRDLRHRRKQNRHRRSPEDRFVSVRRFVEQTFL